MAVDNPHESPKGRSFLDDYQDIENTGPEGSSRPTKGATEALMEQLRNKKKPHPTQEQLYEKYLKSVEREKDDDEWERQRALQLIAQHPFPEQSDINAAKDQARRERQNMVKLRREDARVKAEEAAIAMVSVGNTPGYKLRRLLENVRAKGEYDASDLIVWQELSRKIESSHDVNVPTLQEILENRVYRDHPMRDVWETNSAGDPIPGREQEQ
ncbi:hypothetical protein [Nocardiopsis dassonvillei]|uniref:hypothetical protein n=1 Tax=Nocardiopsis dassonvillei TaxID=2014 RepID=UPI00366C613F